MTIRLNQYSPHFAVACYAASQMCLFVDMYSNILGVDV